MWVCVHTRCVRCAGLTFLFVRYCDVAVRVGGYSGGGHSVRMFSVFFKKIIDE